MPPKQSFGFTVLEVVMALAILTVAGAGLMQISALSASGNTRSKDDAAAIALAIERIEDLKNRGYNALPASTNPQTDGQLTAGGDSGGIYLRVYQVSGEHLVAGIPARTIDVWVSWTGGGYVALSTQIVRPTEPVVGLPVASVRSWNQSR